MEDVFQNFTCEREGKNRLGWRKKLSFVRSEKPQPTQGGLLEQILPFRVVYVRSKLSSPYTPTCINHWVWAAPGREWGEALQSWAWPQRNGQLEAVYQPHFLWLSRKSILEEGNCMACPHVIYIMYSRLSMDYSFINYFFFHLIYFKHFPKDCIILNV